MGTSVCALGMAGTWAASNVRGSRQQPALSCMPFPVLVHVQVLQEPDAFLRVALVTGDTAGFQFKTHPNIDNQLYNNEQARGRAPHQTATRRRLRAVGKACLKQRVSGSSSATRATMRRRKPELMGGASQWGSCRREGEGVSLVDPIGAGQPTRLLANVHAASK